MSNQSCIIQSVPHVNITCSVFGYYPSITLYYRQNSEILDAVRSTEWNNTDGTWNKSVTITAVSSDVLYTCVASDIPGLDGQQRETNVVLAAAVEESTTEHTSTETTMGNGTNTAHLISKLSPSIVSNLPECSRQYQSYNKSIVSPSAFLLFFLYMMCPEANGFNSNLTLKKY